MKKGLCWIIFLFLMVNVASAAGEFRYKDPMGVPTKGLPSVQFRNGSRLVALKEPGAFSDGRIVLKDKGNEVGKDFLGNDRVYINAAFPSRTSAGLAIISGECAGNASFCATRDAYLVLAEGGTLKAYGYGDSRSEILVNIDGAGRVSAKVSQVVLGKDAFGSDIYGSLSFTPGKGFIDTRAKEYYVYLVGKHPSQFFDDPIARRKLAAITGMEKFREVRLAFDVGGAISVEKWRFLLVTGCMAHNCDDTSGVVVIDTTNDDCWLLRRKGGTFDAVGSRAIEKYEVERFEELLSGIELVKGYTLGVGSDGLLSLSLVSKPR